MTPEEKQQQRDSSFSAQESQVCLQACDSEHTEKKSGENQVRNSSQVSVILLRFSVCTAVLLFKSQNIKQKVFLTFFNCGNPWFVCKAHFQSNFSTRHFYFLVRFVAFHCKRLLCVSELPLLCTGPAGSYLQEASLKWPVMTVNTARPYTGIYKH